MSTKKLMKLLEEDRADKKRKPGADNRPPCTYVDAEGDEWFANLVDYVEDVGFVVYVRSQAGYAYGLGDPKKGKAGVTLD